MKTFMFLCVKVIITVALGFMWTTCASNVPAVQPVDATEVKLWSELSPLDLSKRESVSQPTIQWYFREWHKAIPSLRINSGYFFSSRGSLIAVHIFSTIGSEKGTVIFTHEYNSDYQNPFFIHTAQQLISRGYVVVALDFPGHNFSGGERGYVTNFHEYASALNDLLSYGKGGLPKSWHIVGHGMGANAVFDSMILFPDAMKVFTRIVLLAPYVELQNSFQKEAGYAFSTSSSLYTGVDTLFSIRNEPAAWFNAFKKWSESFPSIPASSASNVLILHAENDEHINLQKSVESYSEKIPHAQLRYVRGEKHFFESDGGIATGDAVLSFLLSNSLQPSSKITETIDSP